MLVNKTKNIYTVINRINRIGSDLQQYASEQAHTLKTGNL